MTLRTNAPLESLARAANLPSLPAFSLVLLKCAAVFAAWSQRAKSRKELRELPPEALRDIGVSREEAERESLKRFWMP